MVIGKRVALTARLGNAPTIFKTTVKDGEEPKNVMHNVAVLCSQKSLK
jgi:hypothetical protein